MSDVATRISSLSPEQRALLELKLKKAGITTSVPQTIRRRNSDEPCRLSVDQERLWFIQEVAPQNVAYNVHSADRVHAPLDLPLYEKVFNEILRRHELIRSNFIAVDGIPYQVVRDYTLSIPLVDLSEVPIERRSDQLQRAIDDTGRFVYDLANELLFHVVAIWMDDNDHVLSYSMHHIVTDWWSYFLFAEERDALCEAFSEGRPSPLPELPIQFSDFAVWQREWLNSPSMKSHLEPWLKEMEGVPYMIDMPADRPRPPVQQFIGDRVAVSMSAEVSDGLRELSHKEGASPFMVTLALVYVLIYRYSGQDDMLIGSPSANRNRPETEPLIGYFLNMLMIRGRLKGNPTFLELVQDVRRATLLAYAHQDITFGMLLDALNPPRDTSRNPLFQITCVFLETPGDAAIDPVYLTEDSAPVPNGGASRFDLTFALWNRREGVGGYIEYNGEIFDGATISRLGHHLTRLSENAVRNPAQPIDHLSMLSEAERTELIASSRPQLSHGENWTIHSVFGSHVASRPDEVAVIQDYRRITYGELDRRANQLARRLARAGVGQESLVALSVERSIEMIVAILGILKAGAAYVPIDSEYPRDRIEFMLEDSQPAALVTQKHLQELIPGDLPRIILQENDWSEIAEEDDSQPAVAVNGDNVAYIIYTSGSTGKPKGVMVCHSNVVRMFKASERWFEFKSSDVWTLFHSVAFDFTVWEMWGALLYGGRLVIVPREVTRSPEEYHTLLIKEQVTVLNQTPSAFRHLIKADEDAGTPAGLSLRYVLCGAEVLELQSLKNWFDRRGDQNPKLMNIFGATETTVFVTHEPVSTAALEPSVGSKIGRAIDDVGIYILDKELEPAPVGVPGEMCVGGAGVSRGYLHRPDLTAERFVPDPFGDRPGGRLYRSSDLSRRRAKGDLDYLGRIDQQVKIRGFRIETGEIESVLSSHPAVQETTVIVRGESAEEKRLVAYVVASDGHPPTNSELRGYLREKLPEYMVPSKFVLLDKLPLNSSGKVDRRALPAPPQDEAADRTDARPRTEAESSLAGIWSEVLGVAHVGVEDNFFELGGDSILGIQVVARANKVGLKITPRQIFQHQTISELARLAGHAAAASAEQGQVAGDVPLTPIQQWFFEQQNAEPHHFNQTLVLELKGEGDAATVASTLEILVRHHDALRLRFHRLGDSWRQINEAACDIALTVVDLEAIPGNSADEVISALAGQAQASLNLSEGPLVRAVLFNAASGRNSKLLLVTHHLIVDGVSWRILLEDIESIYTQVLPGKQPRLSSKTTSYKEWAESLREYAGSSVITGQVDYWLSQTAEAQSLPVDHPDGDNIEASTGTVTVSLNEGETRSLLSEAPAAYRTQINDILLTALALAFESWRGTAGLIVNLEGHGREEFSDQIDLSRTVGWFTTIFPLQLGLAGISGTGPALKLIKEKLRQVPNRGIGYGLLRYLSENEEVQNRLQAQPKPEVSFNYLGQLDQLGDETESFAVNPEPMGDVHSRFAKRSHLFEIDAWVLGGRLELAWRFSKNLHDEASVERLASGYIKSLRDILDHCLSPGTGGFTPSDFPLVGLDQEVLDRLTETPRQIEDIYPLSPMQEGMLFHSLYSPDAGVYVTQLVCELIGRLDDDALERAWQGLCDRHPILRTGIEWENTPSPVQIVNRAVTLQFDREDWRELSDSRRVELIEERTLHDRKQGFDFRRPPLMRVRLIRTAERAYLLLWSHHHVLLDGWSLGILLQELFAGYAANSAGEEAVFESIRPYRDYIEWLKGQDQEKAKSYWRDLLDGFTTPVRLGIDRGRPLGSKLLENTVEERIELGSEVTTDLASLARRHQLTVNSVVCGAWGLLLARYSGEDDIVYGVTVSGRSMALKGVEQMLGLFINTLPVRLSVRDGAPVTDWLKQVQQQQAEQREYEYASLAQVQTWSEAGSGEALFQSIVVFENYPVQPGVADRLQSEAELEIGQIKGAEPTNYPLTVIAMPGESLVIRLGVDSRYYDRATANKILGHLSNLLKGMAAAPEARLGEFSMLSPEELQQLVFDWNQTAVDYGRARTLDDLVEARIVSGPGSNMRAYVLDRRLRLVAPGVVGELHIGGQGVARGYVDAPELTAEQFVPDPFSTPGERLYRTGDLVRPLEGGEIEYLGRENHHVKLLGRRIDLWEIELVLSQYPGIRDVVAGLRRDAQERDVLVACVVTAGEQQPDNDALREYLIGTLPEYMAPAAFVFLDRLPVTESGRIDFDALAGLVGDVSEEATITPVAPRNATEEIVAGLCAQVLGVEHIGIHDNFFNLGGHSLLVMRLVARLRESLQVTIPLKRVFDGPTVAKLAAVILEDPATRAKIAKRAEILMRLARLSEAEAEALLEQRLKRGGKEA